MKLLRCITMALTAVTLTSATVVKPSTSAGDNFELLILHNNDMHARFEQTSRLSGACTTDDREAGKCYGGFARVAHVVKEARRAAQSGEGPPVLYLNAGDTYTGTAWFTIYKWKIAAEFINALQPDAVSLGNNELEHGSEDLSPFLKNIDTTILASNVILKSAEYNENIEKYIIFEIKGVKIGIIGYLTPDYNILDSSGNIEYINEVIALTDGVSTLKDLNVNIIIALGHSSLENNIEIAREVDGIDLLICGSKNNFFWNGTSSNVNVPDETIVTRANGNKVPVIYSYAYDKYLGNLIISFNNNGELVKYSSNPITLDSSIAEDFEAHNIAEKFHEELSQTSEEVVGTTSVVIDGENCKTEECNFGNLITDAIMYYNAINFEGEEPWTDAPIAIIHGGAIAASISPSNRPAPVTRRNLLSALPLASNIVAVTVNGTILSQVLEHSVADYTTQNPSGRFLQFSGIRVIYDLAQEPGSRVVQAVARCGTCYVPEFYNIDDWRTYKLLVPAALADGDFGYTMFRDHIRENYNYDEVTCTADYINRRSPVYPEIAGRIVLQNVPVIENDNDSAATLSASIIIVVLLPLILY